MYSGNNLNNFAPMTRNRFIPQKIIPNYVSGSSRKFRILFGSGSSILLDQQQSAILYAYGLRHLTWLDGVGSGSDGMFPRIRPDRDPQTR